MQAVRHEFYLLVWVAWTGAMVWRISAQGRVRRAIARKERIAALWPAAPGRIRGGSVKLENARWQLELTYHAFESGHGIGLWHHFFLTKPEAEHVKDVLSGFPCVVHYNPDDPDDTTLLWSELEEKLAANPFVRRLAPLGRTGYRWLTGLALISALGLMASLTLFAMVMRGTSLCVCDAMAALLTASPFVLIGSLIPMARMLVAAPDAGILRRLKFVTRPWGRWGMGLAILGTLGSLAHYGPIFRALPMDAEIPDRVFAGTLGVLAIPVYLFATMIAVEGLRRLRPVGVEERVATAV